MSVVHFQMLDERSGHVPLRERGSGFFACQLPDHDSLAWRTLQTLIAAPGVEQNRAPRTQYLTITLPLRPELLAMLELVLYWDMLNRELPDVGLKRVVDDWPCVEPVCPSRLWQLLEYTPARLTELRADPALIREIVQTLHMQLRLNLSLPQVDGFRRRSLVLGMDLGCFRPGLIP